MTKKPFQGTGTAMVTPFKSDGSVAMTGNINAGNQKLINLALGSVGSPSISFTGDSNNGIFSSAALASALAAARDPMMTLRPARQRR